VGAVAPASIKDSFNDLELDGYRVLLRGNWIAAPTCPDGVTQYDWRRLDPDEAIRISREFAEVDSGYNGAFVRRDLLEAFEVAMLVASSRKGVVGCCWLNISQGAIGISNIGALPGVELWPDLIAAASHAFEGDVVVGWEADDDLTLPLAYGFDQVSPLRILLRE
jgi:hypothetical protein